MSATSTHASRAAHARSAKAAASSAPRVRIPLKPRQPRETSPAPKERRFLTLNEVVAEFGGSIWTWRHRVSDGTIASVKLNGENSRVMIERASVETLFRSGYRPASWSEPKRGLKEPFAPAPPLQAGK